MDTAPGPSRISRVDLRYRHRAQHAPPAGEIAPEQDAGEEGDQRRADVDEPLLVREQRGRAVMGEGHRQFHRRAAQAASRVLTISVNVEQTVDLAGNVVGVATVTPVLPVVPPVPTNGVPTVPTVPPFPSDLVVPTVPSYPFPAAATTPTVTASAPTATAPSILPTTFPVSNSTISSSVISSTQLSSSRNSTSSTRSSTPLSTSSSTSFTLTSTSSTPMISSTTSYASASSAGGGGGGGGVIPQSTAAPPESSPTTAAADAQSDSDSPLGTPQVVGTIVGSLAGAALLLCVILLLIKRHKKKRGVQLTGDGDTDQRQPMTQAATRSSFIPPSFLNRFSGASRSTAESSGTGERSFQRVSGRKLPSAFSEGMTSEQFDRPQGTLSGSSFYQDDKGFYGGAGVMSKDFGKEIGDTSNTGAVGREERVMPSPARTPVIHHPDDAPPWGTSRNGGGSTLSPPHTPSNPFVDPIHIPRGTLGRSHPSHDGSRSSRFTENV
ncbi:hypothetical protein K458DRAFT_208595 [Lentithecium fluviatile CBS 122367]|uniref:Mid2 domain-containing protein n=1 Tax=Lentithecium fluviatile CBS 122367 TaxID=1168545 RepID=A0A6G1J6H0_9PLEO|nr:hypothetical protein K458DRAFT_208595 [Lentithecium fluviatile CBS 122367]